MLTSTVCVLNVQFLTTEAGASHNHHWISAHVSRPRLSGRG